MSETVELAADTASAAATWGPPTGSDLPLGSSTSTRVSQNAVRTKNIMVRGPVSPTRSSTLAEGFEGAVRTGETFFVKCADNFKGNCNHVGSRRAPKASPPDGNEAFTIA